MPITSADIAALPTYTNAEIVKSLRVTIVQIALGGQSRGIDGRMKTEADLPKLQAALAYFEELVDVEAAETALNDNDGVALAIFRQSL